MDETTIHIPGIFYRNGSWTIDCVKSVHGKRVHMVRSGFATQQEAKEALPRLIATRIDEAKKADASPSFEEFLSNFKEYRGHHVRPSTVMQIDSMSHIHMREFHGKTLAETFNPIFVGDWYHGLLADRSVSNQWKNKIISATKKMFEMAWKWKYISAEDWTDIANLLETVQESKRKGQEKEIWTPRQLERFLAALPKGSTDEAMFRLFCALGARISEFTGLTWECFDKKRGIIEIKQQVIYQGLHHFVLTGELKTSESYRLCRLDPQTLGILLAYREQQAPKGEGEFIFPSAPRDHHRPTAKSTLRRKMGLYMEKAGVPKITPHGVRHTKATMLMAVCKNMAEVKAAARYLGHSATMMIDTYGHAKEDSTASIIARLDKHSCFQKSRSGLIIEGNQ